MARGRTSCKYYKTCGNSENCKECKAYTKKPKHIVYCVGAKWFDKVNGNTYHNVKVIDGDNITYLGYEYGYGSQYRYRADEYFKAKYGDGKYQLIDLGASYYKKVEVKNGYF